MRMSEEDIFIIKSTILKYIQNAKIILFGNRINDNKKGGDIDILIQTDENVSLEQELRILAEIELKGLTRKIDLLFQTSTTKNQNIINTAIKERIIL